ERGRTRQAAGCGGTRLRRRNTKRLARSREARGLAVRHFRVLHGGFSRACRKLDRLCQSLPGDASSCRFHGALSRLSLDRQPPQMGVREVGSMSNAPLIGVKACVFDAYGTLFDFAAAAKGCRDVLGDGIEKLTALWREKQLQYTWLRALQGRHTDFWQVTGDALDFALETLAIEKPGLRDRLMNLYLTLDAFPEVPDVLRRLKQAGLGTAILSNGSPRMLEAAVKAAELDALLDAVLSVEAVGVY